MLGLGLWISTRVQTRDAAMQMAMGTVIPSIFLSGYIFPTDSMPAPFWIISQLIPTTWMVDASRGVILRALAGPSWAECLDSLDHGRAVPDRQHQTVPQAILICKKR